MRALISPLILTIAATAAVAEPATRQDKAQVLAWAKSFFADPYSLRSTEISDRTTVDGVPVLCVSFNARSVAGGYTGIYRKPFEITSTGLVAGERSRRVTTGTCWNPQVTMRPFPELGAIK